jgi:integrase
VLSNVELGAVWRAAGPGDFGDIVRLLILTGQRRDEVGAMWWSELDLEAAVWTIPATRTKNSRAHTVPLSPAAVQILSARVRQVGREYVFGSRAGPFQGWSRAKAALDARVALTAPWRLHDLRRSLATGLGDIGVLPHVVEALLNHLSGFRGGVAGTYNYAAYASEKRDALNRWADHVKQVCDV